MCGQHQCRSLSMELGEAPPWPVWALEPVRFLLGNARTHTYPQCPPLRPARFAGADWRSLG
eukprot:6019078-Prymnesium_polylepis.1